MFWFAGIWGTIKINPIPGVGFEISNEGVRRSESVYVVSVPACRMFTLTGITLHPGDTITVSASGIVATSSSYDWFRDNPINLLKWPEPIIGNTNLENISTLFTNELDLYSNMFQKSTIDAFDRLHDPDWRNPDGSRIYEGANFDKYTTSNQEIIYHNHMLRHDKQYGMLLGCVLPSRIAFPLNDTNNVEVITNILEQQRENKIFTIGRQQVIKCYRDGDQMILHFPPGNDDSQTDITNDEMEGQLVLLVNDVVLTTNLINELRTNNITLGDLNLITNAIFGSHLFVNEGVQLNSFLNELWYLDNEGTFTVTMQRENN
jgi:hypothetical protein